MKTRETGRCCAICRKTTAPSGRKDTSGFKTILSRNGIPGDKAHPECVAALAAMTREQVQAGRFRKKPVVIEAVHVSRGLGFIHDPVPDWIKEALRDKTMTEADNGGWNITTLEGTMRADKGDWIIRGVKGEIYPCKPDIFEATYEPALASTRQEPAPAADAEVDTAIGALRIWQRHDLLRQYDDTGHVLHKNLVVSEHLDTLIAALRRYAGDGGVTSPLPEAAARPLR